MKFNNGSERVRLENRWRNCVSSTGKQECPKMQSRQCTSSIWMFSIVNVPMLIILSRFCDQDDEDSVDFKRYEKAITVTDVYHETKNRFAWVGEIKNEHLLAALEKLNAKGFGAADAFCL